MDKDIDIHDVRPAYQVQMKISVSLSHFCHHVIPSARHQEEEGKVERLSSSSSLKTKAVKETHKFSSFEVTKVFFNQHGVFFLPLFTGLCHPERTSQITERSYDLDHI